MKKAKSAPRYWIKKNGLLYARLQYQDDTGRWREKYKRITDKRKARSVVEEMRYELKHHGVEALEKDKMSFAELVEEYSKARAVPAVIEDGVKVAGMRSYKSVQSSLRPLGAFFGKKHIRNLRVSDIEEYQAHRLNKPVVIELAGDEEDIVRRRKISSVNRELETLRAMLNFAIENDWLLKSPFTKKKGLISKAAESERNRVLSLEEEQRLLNECRGRRGHLRPILICALDTAMRRGEIFKMRWRDVDLVRGEITIPLTNTKTEDERIVGMTERLRQELLSLWEVSPKDREQRVFGISNTIKTAWQTLCARAQVDDFRFHDCRHTATTRMIASGSPHAEVMKITGHTRLKTFLRYLNITTETATKVAGNLDRYLTSSATPEANQTVH